MTKSRAWMIITTSLLVGVGLGLLVMQYIRSNAHYSAACVWPALAITTGALGDAGLEQAMTKLAASDRFNETEKELLAKAAPCARATVAELANGGAK